MKLARRFLFAALLLACSQFTMAQSNPISGQSIEGAWNVSIHFDAGPTCASAPAVFTREGTVIADSCAQNLATGYGAWIRIGPRKFAVTFIGNVYGPGGAVAGSYKVRAADGTLDAGGNSFSGPFKTEFFDLAGNLTATFTGTVVARRILVEPL
jgi:hypothetical protein